MIAKGHDFPRVTLVGVVSADVGLGLADFRAAERTFQLLTQVAGRAGRGADPGEAIVQTIYPHHYSIEHACRQDYTAFFAKELGYRQAMRYPPLTAMVNIVVKGADARAALTDAATLAQHLRNNADAGRFTRAGTGARAGRQAARRISRADLSEGQPSREHARGRARGARRRARHAPPRVPRHRSGLDSVSGPLFTNPSRRVLMFWAALAALNLAAGVFISSQTHRMSDLENMMRWGRAWLVEGRNVYEIDQWLVAYPPNGVVALSPLGLLPLGVAHPFWISLSIVLAILAPYLAARFFRPHDPFRVVALPVLMFLCWGGVRTLAQFSLIALAFSMAAMVLADRKRMMGGLCLGLALDEAPGGRAGVSLERVHAPLDSGADRAAGGGQSVRSVLRPR